MLISLFKYNLTKTHQLFHGIPPSIYRMGVQLPLISWFFIMGFNFDYVSRDILERQDVRADEKEKKANFSIFGQIKDGSP